jgi:hypothetical protein
LSAALRLSGRDGLVQAAIEFLREGVFSLGGRGGAQSAADCETECGTVVLLLFLGLIPEHRGVSGRAAQGAAVEFEPRLGDLFGGPGGDEVEVALLG